MRAWLVERDYDDKGLLRLVYATEDGRRRLVRERAPALTAREGVTAAIEVEGDRLEPVEEAATRERYADEVARMRERHDPDDPV